LSQKTESTNMPAITIPSDVTILIFMNQALILAGMNWNQ